MAKTRESCIRDIRSRLPYLSERDLQNIAGFIRGICSHSHCYGFSIAEHDRPVLSSEEQQCADQAANCLRTLAYALTSTRGVTHSCIHKDGVEDPDALIVGWDNGDLVAVDVKLLMFLWNEAGWKRVKRALLMDWMERYGYILSRNKRPKTIKVNDERREVVYIFKTKLQPFIDDAALRPE